VSDWWSLIVIAAVVGGVVLFLRARQKRPRRGSGNHLGQTHTPSDVRQDREDSRRAHMSDEERAWETASLRKDQATREPSDPAGDHGSSHR
jgi:hypothetical protein